MAVRRHFVHFIKVFLKFGSFIPMVGSWNVHTFRALFIAVHITFIFEIKYSIWPPHAIFCTFAMVFLLFGAFKAILWKCLSWFYVYWFLKLLIQQKCWHHQKNAHVCKFCYHVYLRFMPFWVYLFLLIQQSFWSKIVEVSSAYIRVYSFS